MSLKLQIVLNNSVLCNILANFPRRTIMDFYEPTLKIKPLSGDQDPTVVKTHFCLHHSELLFIDGSASSLMLFNSLGDTNLKKNSAKLLLRLILLGRFGATASSPCLYLPPSKILRAENMSVKVAVLVI